MYIPFRLGETDSGWFLGDTAVGFLFHFLPICKQVEF